MDVCDQMREDWNRRAREDAEYYVAFGRRGQDDAEFFASGAYLAGELARELLRLDAEPQRRRALEIGCGMGRLMHPLGRHVGAIHGIDVSDELVRRAREKLKDIPQAHVHHTRGADLAAFPDESFDFVYSYAVFQHIPSREVVFRYLDEARRVLAPGGVFRFQLNGLPPDPAPHDTWNGVRIAPAEMIGFARESGLKLMALEGVGTQYMWVTLQKKDPRRPAPPGPVRIWKIANACTLEPFAPTRGRYAFLAVFALGLPEDSDLNTLGVTVAGLPARPLYLGPPQPGGRQQLNIQLPAGVAPGLQPVQLLYRGGPAAPAGFLRVIPSGAVPPRLVSLSDGIELLSARRIVSRTIKLAIEDADLAGFEAAVDGCPIPTFDSMLTDPMPPRFEINLYLPPSVGSGPHRLELRIGSRRLTPVFIEVV